MILTGTSKTQLLPSKINFVVTVSAQWGCWRTGFWQEIVETIVFITIFQNSKILPHSTINCCAVFWSLISLQTCGSLTPFGLPELYMFVRTSSTCCVCSLNLYLVSISWYLHRVVMKALNCTAKCLSLLIAEHRLNPQQHFSLNQISVKCWTNNWALHFYCQLLFL